jgi:DNA-binding MarR family transcriptional regulator
MAIDPPFHPSLPYLLLRVVARLESAVHDWTRRHGLKLHAARVIMRLMHRDHLLVRELAELTSLETSTLSHLLKRMEADGLLTRLRDSVDNRHVRVSLTGKGRRIGAEIEPVYLGINDLTMRGLSDAETAALKAALDRVYANVLTIEDDIKALELSLAARDGAAPKPL